MRLAVCRLDLVSSLYAVNAFESRPCSVVFGTVRVQFLWPCLWCTKICIRSASMVLFRSGMQGHVTLLLPKRVVLSTCKRVPLVRRAAGKYVSQESATPAYRRLYHAGKETELVMQFQVPEPTLWVAKGSYDRFQFELSTGTSTTFAERYLSCRPMAVRVLSFLQCKTLTDQPSGY